MKQRLFISPAACLFTRPDLYISTAVRRATMATPSWLASALTCKRPGPQHSTLLQLMARQCTTHEALYYASSVVTSRQCSCSARQSPDLAVASRSKLRYASEWRQVLKAGGIEPWHRHCGMISSEIHIPLTHYHIQMSRVASVSVEVIYWSVITDGIH